MAEKRTRKDEIREAAEADCETFIRLVHPTRCLGSIHSELLLWMTGEEGGTHQLVLMPRDHQKSAIAAYIAAWEITRNPAIRILYLSATANLAIKQLKFIKDILTSDIYRRYWPDMVNIDEGKREKWTETEISVDHPTRKFWNVRDSTVFTGGLTTTITGLHADLIIGDDIVIRENAYTQEGRTKVEQQFSMLASIGGTGSRQLFVGTRYHPKDLYDKLMNIVVSEFDDNGDKTGEYNMFNKFERVVETDGVFLWPKQQGMYGRYFGFDRKELERKRAQYIDAIQFRAQYYNDPNDIDGGAIKRECFQYYNRDLLTRQSGEWQIKGRRLNIFAAIDFAYSTKARSDYTSITVVGVDSEHKYYVLDIDRFKTILISDYYQHIFALYKKWEFRTIRAEVTAAQKAIVSELKQNYIAKYGLALSVKEHSPNRHMGAKEERIAAVLQAKYTNGQIFHFQGGFCQLLEEELVMTNPSHDDIKDSLASAIEESVAPARQFAQAQTSQIIYHPRFGGIA